MIVDELQCVVCGRATALRQLLLSTWTNKSNTTRILWRTLSVVEEASSEKILHYPQNFDRRLLSTVWVALPRVNRRFSHHDVEGLCLFSVPDPCPSSTSYYAAAKSRNPISGVAPGYQIRINQCSRRLYRKATTVFFHFNRWSCYKIYPW